MGIRYSQILGELFYNIGLSDDHSDLCDAFFSASSHHYLLLRYCQSKFHREFHLSRHRAHLRALKEIVYTYGDFRKAKDQSLRGLEKRASWDPRSSFLPDPKMFDSMKIDFSCGSVGQAHPFDWYVTPSDQANFRFNKRLAS